MGPTDAPSRTLLDYGVIPAGGSLKPKPFYAHVAETRLRLFKDLIKLSPIAPPVYENSKDRIRRPYGMRREWLLNAKEVWENEFDWREHEDRINSYPNFTVEIEDDQDGEIQVHFIALFSRRLDALPIVLYHGWPGNFLEFTDLLDLLQERYPPEDLPYHIIAPSLPGYAYSSGPPLNRDYSVVRAAQCLDDLMTGLGFESYIAHGTDIGAGIAKIQAQACDGCIGLHLSTLLMSPPENKDELEMDELEKKALKRGGEFLRYGMAYATEQGTKPATVGLSLQASPISMLSW